MTQKKIRNFTKLEAVWLACAIDGEGSFGIYTYIGDGRRALIQIGHTDPKFVKEFRRIIGCGSSVIRTKHGKQHKGKKPIYHYSLKGSARCYDVLMQVVPYLITKKAKAKKVIREIERKPFGRWKQYSVLARAK